MAKRKKVCALDLETIANKAMIPLLPDVNAAKNLKDPKKIEADIATKKQAQINKMGLDPLFNMICCAGWCAADGSGSIMLEEESATGEKELLLKMWDLLARYDYFVTFNGRQFDMRCIYLHGITHGIRPPVIIDHGRYNRGNHCDLRLVLSGSNQYAPGKLDTYLKIFLQTGKKEGIDGAMVQDYWDMGLYSDISEYCTNDGEQTYKLFRKVEVSGLLE